MTTALDPYRIWQKGENHLNPSLEVGLVLAFENSPSAFDIKAAYLVQQHLLLYTEVAPSSQQPKSPVSLKRVVQLHISEDLLNERTLQVSHFIQGDYANAGTAGNHIASQHAIFWRVANRKEFETLFADCLRQKKTIQPDLWNRLKPNLPLFLLASSVAAVGYALSFFETNLS